MTREEADDAADPFLAGNSLPLRWQGRDRFVILDDAFGTGATFLAAWQAWRADPRQCARLVFIGLAPQSITAAELPALRRDPERQELAAALARAWPPPTANLHRLSFEGGRVELLLAFGDAAFWWRELAVAVDAFCLADIAAADEPRRCKAIGRLAAPGATLVAETTSAVLRHHLATAGFVLQTGAGGSDESEVTCAHFAPTFVSRRAPASASHGEAGNQHALIVGAGLAGCAAAWALAAQGWRSTVLERRTRIADEASGNPAGLFHGIVNAHDGLHARFNRAAALAAHEAVRLALLRGVDGSVDGLLRLETSLDAQQMRRLLRELGLPPGYVQALDADEASERAGIALSRPAWFYPTGGWVDPRGLARAFLDQAGAEAELRIGVDAAHLERAGRGWRVLDAHGGLIAEAETIVLANAADALRLLGAPDWPIDSVRGQISIADGTRLASPRLPIAGSGYLLPEIAGRAMFGATAQRGDADPSVRDGDHALNLAQLERLLGREVDLVPADLEGRTAWRCSAADRLPLIGAVPDPAADGARLDQPRFVPRLPGLFVFSALGSRGITWSALGARVLAAWITGAPMPLEASLRDAIDPARFVSRRLRRATRG